MSNWQILSVTCGGILPTPLPGLAAPTLLVFPADSMGEALAGQYAARAAATALGRITALDAAGADLIVRRSSHSGRLSLRLQVAPSLAVATAHDHSFCSGNILLGDDDPRLPIETAALPDQGISLEAARIVVGGGRGLNTTTFAHLARIARQLDGAVSASLPAVDLGLAPVSRQVGQSGKFVNPDIYFAVGMSGTPQHFAGVGARARILAVNADAEAPIFSFAEAGVVADAGSFLPMLADALASMKEASE